ncbi:unnamed protein product [Merluccius merluccius]
MPPQQQTFYQADPVGVYPPPQQPAFDPSAFQAQGPYAGQPAYGLQHQFAQGHNPFASHAAASPPTAFSFPPATMPDASKGPSRSSTPQSAVGGRDPATSPAPLFQSRCSSPLQLNLLQLEERQDSAVLPPCGQGGNISEREKGGVTGVPVKEKELQQRVLRQDREKLRLLQKNQPHFSEEQRRELMEVHPWLRGCLPKAIDVKVCLCCEDPVEGATTTGQPRLDVVSTKTEMRELSCQRQASEGPQSSAERSCVCPSQGPVAPPSAS